jgi:putative aldouronate transport system substrate-binding protein
MRRLKSDAFCCFLAVVVQKLKFPNNSNIFQEEKMKRLGFVLALSVMTAAFSAWGSGQNSAPAGKESVTIRVLVPGNVQSFLPGEDENNNEMHRYLEKNSGYKLVYSVLPADAAASQQKLTLEFASGNPSDMIFNSSRHNFLQWVSEGYLTVLDNFIVKNSRLMATDCMDPPVRAMGIIDGKQYAVTYPTAGGPSSYSMAGLKKYTEPAGITRGDMSLNHVTDMLAAAKKAYPDKITLTGAGSGMKDYMLPGFQWVYGAYGVVTPWREVSKGQLEYTPISKDMRDCLAYIADINARAYLDPEYSTLKVERVREKMLNGDVVFANMGWYDWPSPNLVRDADTNPLWEIYGNAVGAGGRSGQDIGSPLQSYVVVPKTSKIPEAVVDYAGLLCQPEVYDFLSYGEKDIDYRDMPDGTRINLGTNRRPTLGTNYTVYYRFYENKAQRDFRMLYAVPNDKWGEYRIKTHSSLKNTVDPTTAMPVIPIYIEKMSDINDLCAEYFLKIATGALPVSAFDEFVRRFNAIGGNDVIKAVNDWYSKK